MTVRIDAKSAAIGAAVTGLLVLAAGAAREYAGEPLGRYRLACSSDRAYLVDTVNGQVWYSGTTGFTEPKLSAREAALSAEDQHLVGQWTSADPDHPDLRIRLERDGTCVAFGDDETHEGQWRVADGGRILITVDDETVTGRIGEDGRLVLWEGDDESDRIAFTKDR